MIPCQVEPGAANGLHPSWEHFRRLGNGHDQLVFQHVQVRGRPLGDRPQPVCIVNAGCELEFFFADRVSIDTTAAVEKSTGAVSAANSRRTAT